jgi:hypothetical protein
MSADHSRFKAVPKRARSGVGDSPSNMELENGATWSRVWQNKNVRIVAIGHN